MIRLRTVSSILIPIDHRLKLISVYLLYAELYIYPFAEAVRAGAGSIMCS